MAGYRQPDLARDTSLGAVPRRPGRAAAPWHDLPAGRARDGREHGRARGPADPHRGRRGPPLGAGAQAAGARAREGECCGRAATAAGIARAGHPHARQRATKEPRHDSDAHDRLGRADARRGDLQHQGCGRDHQAERDHGRAGPDRDHTQGRGVQERQGHPLPLSPAGEAQGRDPGADRLQPDRPLHDDRPAGGSLADPQPAEARVWTSG